jgi:hypothetical protein
MIINIVLKRIIFFPLFQVESLFVVSLQAVCLDLHAYIKPNTQTLQKLQKKYICNNFLRMS